MAAVIAGKILYPAGKCFPSKFGGRDRQNIVVSLNDGSERKIWFKAHDPQYTKLKPGMNANFLLDDNNELALLPNSVSLEDTQLDNNTSSKPKFEPPPDPTAIPPEQKQAIAGYITSRAKIYAFCFSEAEKAMHEQGLKPSEETVRCAASSLFISASSKFGL